MRSGIYIVKLLNEQKICSYNGDKRRKGKGTPVGLGNLKVGKTIDFDRRRKNYEKDFGSVNVQFDEVLLTNKIDQIEKSIKSEIKIYRIKSNQGRLLEWLEGISYNDLRTIIERNID